jgi:hypothetical protein
MQGDVLTDRREVAAVIEEAMRDVLRPALEAAVREALVGVDLTGAREAQARRELEAERRRICEVAEENRRNLRLAYQIAHETIWANLPHLSPGDPTGYARGVQLIATGLPEPLAYVPLIGTWRERR